VVPGVEVQEFSVSLIGASIPGRTVLLLLLLLLLLIANELSLGGSSPCTSTDKTHNKYT
jgi:hypothetical protein